MKYPAEQDSGPVEYKSILVEKDDDRLERLASQMRYRLFEGGGEAIYILGVHDDGSIRGLTPEEEAVSLEILRIVAEKVGASIRVLDRKEYGEKVVTRILVRLSREENPPSQLNIIVVGNVDAGKSTTVGTLCSGTLDDGRGSNMRKVARYTHEILTGRTSSVAIRLLGFDLTGKPVNWGLPNPLDEAQIYLSSKKIISLVDVGGHERYLRTALRGVLSKYPDYAMLVVAANSGLQVMGREHLGVCVALKIPVFIVFTKIDIVSPEVEKGFLEETLTIIRRLDKKPFTVKSLSDVYEVAPLMPSGRIVPIFRISNTTGEGLDALTEFMNLLPPRKRWGELIKKPLLAYVTEIYDVKGVGTVIAVAVERGTIQENSYYFLGPLSDGTWRKTRVKSIHVNRVPVVTCRAGEEATLAITDFKRDEIEKGLVLAETPLHGSQSLVAEILVLKHPTTIKRGYQTVFHIHSIRTPVEITWMEKEPMRTGDIGLVRLRFLKKQWYIEENEKFILRDSRTRAIGTVYKAE
ncbi:MAG: GTP-binding protein [Infirmifilum sp.]